MTRCHDAHRIKAGDLHAFVAGAGLATIVGCFGRCSSWWPTPSWGPWECGAKGRPLGKPWLDGLGEGSNPRGKGLQKEEGSEERVRKEGGTEGRREHGKAVRKKEIWHCWLLLAGVPDGDGLPCCTVWLRTSGSLTPTYWTMDSTDSAMENPTII